MNQLYFTRESKSGAEKQTNPNGAKPKCTFLNRIDGESS
jgi:hypothetical protein